MLRDFHLYTFPFLFSNIDSFYFFCWSLFKNVSPRCAINARNGARRGGFSELIISSRCGHVIGVRGAAHACPICVDAIY